MDEDETTAGGLVDLVVEVLHVSVGYGDVDDGVPFDLGRREGAADPKILVLAGNCT